MGPIIKKLSKWISGAGGWAGVVTATAPVVYPVGVVILAAMVKNSRAVREYVARKRFENPLLFRVVSNRCIAFAKKIGADFTVAALNDILKMTDPEKIFDNNGNVKTGAFDDMSAPSDKTKAENLQGLIAELQAENNKSAQYFYAQNGVDTSKPSMKRRRFGAGAGDRSELAALADSLKAAPAAAPEAKAAPAPAPRLRFGR